VDDRRPAILGCDHAGSRRIEYSFKQLRGPFQYLIGLFRRYGPPTKVEAKSERHR
jgi:hypothetical protein